MEILRRHLDMLRDRNVRDGAVLVADNRTGEILAYAGNQGPDSSAPFVDGVRAPRQAGSTLKPFLYGLALERRILTAASSWRLPRGDPDAGRSVHAGELLEPLCRSGALSGTALSSSLNVPAVRVLGWSGRSRSPAPPENRLRRIGKDGEYYGWSWLWGPPTCTLLGTG
jgi:penicillin-binding protein 1C